MPNHVHFVCVPQKEDSLARTFNTLHMRYAQFINKKKEAKGHLWQGRFYSCILDEMHLYAAIRYVETNPVRAKIVESPVDYKWSSARGHLSDVVDPILSEDSFLGKNKNDWLNYLMGQKVIDDTMIKNIRQSTINGRPCGDENFTKTIESFLRKRLTAMPRGRPFKEK